MFGCDRFWLLTWTTYGTWLPGDERGFVSRMKEGPGPRVEHDAVSTPYDADLPGLKRSSELTPKSPPVSLTRSQAEILFNQFQQTASVRRWSLLAVAIMARHIHLFVGVPGDPEPEGLLRDFKSYGSRALNRCWPKPASGTWWTESGSKRKKEAEAAIRAAIKYVRDQPNPLIVWLAEEAKSFRGERGALAPESIAQERKNCLFKSLSLKSVRQLK
jgi:REP element-mobilizing transposase RayT